MSEPNEKAVRIARPFLFWVVLASRGRLDVAPPKRRYKRQLRSASPVQATSRPAIVNFSKTTARLCKRYR